MERDPELNDENEQGSPAGLPGSAARLLASAALALTGRCQHLRQKQADAEAGIVEEIVVSGELSARMGEVGSWSAVDAEELDLIGASHPDGSAGAGPRCLDLPWLRPGAPHGHSVGCADRCRRLWRVPLSREWPARAPGRVLQCEQPVRAEHRAGRPDRSLARSRPAPCSVATRCTVPSTW